MRKQSQKRAEQDLRFHNFVLSGTFSPYVLFVPSVAIAWICVIREFVVKDRG
jgi:hypothetical protein